MVRVKRKPPNSINHGLIRLAVGTSVFLIVTVVVVVVVSSLLGSRNDGEGHNNGASIIIPAAAAVPEYPLESVFRSTLHQCLPLEKGSKCKQYIAPGESSHPRIAFLAPPGDVSATVLTVVQSIVALYNNLQQQQQQHPPPKHVGVVGTPIEVIGSTHVPPYGYGKTHGYTKIIRLVPHPLALDVADVFHSLDVGNGTPSLDDIRTVLRQLLRFHCRLSHVAAHTALLTLDVRELSPQQIVQRLMAFLMGDDYDEDRHRQMQDQLIRQMEPFPSILRGSQDRAAHLFAARNLDVDRVLMEELAFTKNMTVWPCPSFWSAGEQNTGVTSPITRQLAQALSPNCSDPMATCFVHRDKCEDKGDALCK